LSSLKLSGLACFFFGSHLKKKLPHCVLQALGSFSVLNISLNNLKTLILSTYYFQLFFFVVVVVAVVFVLVSNGCLQNTTINKVKVMQKYIFKFSSFKTMQFYCLYINIATILTIFPWQHCMCIQLCYHHCLPLFLNNTRNFKVLWAKAMHGVAWIQSILAKHSQQCYSQKLCCTFGMYWYLDAP